MCSEASIPMACHCWVINSFSISGETCSLSASGPNVHGPCCLFLGRCFVPGLGLRRAAGTGVHIYQVLVQGYQTVYNSGSTLH